MSYIDPQEGRIHYLNTDLELESDGDLRPLVRALTERGFWELFAGEVENGWRATLELGADTQEPEIAIAAMLDVIAVLPEPAAAQWRSCRKREFDLGYECGQAPRGWSCFNQSISAELVARVSGAGAGLRITLYPYRE